MGLSSSTHPRLKRGTQTRSTDHSDQCLALYSSHVSYFQGLVEEDG